MLIKREQKKPFDQAAFSRPRSRRNIDRERDAPGGPAGVDILHSPYIPRAGTVLSVGFLVI